MSTDDFDLTALLDRQWHRFGRHTPLDGLFLSRMEHPSDFVHSVYCPGFCIVVQGAKATMLGDTVYPYTAGDGLLVSADLPVTSRITQASKAKPYLSLRLDIDPKMVADLLTSQAAALSDWQGENPPPTASHPGLASNKSQTKTGGAHIFEPLRVTKLDPALTDPVKRLLALLDHPRDLAVLAPLIRLEIIWKLLGSPLGTTLQQIGLADAHAARIGRATAYIRRNYKQTLHVAELAELAHMSIPSFHRHFKSVTTMTPVQFQKQLRLQEARRLLLVCEDVASVSYAIGYESPSQFSREYRRLFGISPGRDSDTMRASLTLEQTI